MSARRVGQPNVTFGPATVYLDFPRSDGDATKWPTNTTRVLDDEGQVNFMELLDINESGQAKKWRASVGKAIATKLVMQGDSNNYVLRNWPQGYRMYDHHKGPAANPRHDLYLYGCGRGRFRSINEFIPHAIWLFQDSTLNPANCECKYCTRQPQKGITANMGDILGTPSSASPAPRARKTREKKLNRPYASVQKVLRPALKPSPHLQDSPTLAERNADLRAVFSRNSMKLKRWYRDGEVVWCHIHPSIPGPTGPDSDIIFWPGLVQEYKLRAVPVPRGKPSAPNSPSQPPIPTPGPSSTGSNAHQEGRGTVYDKTDEPPFTVDQSTVYLVELFAVNKSIHVSDAQVIPYQAYVPHDEVILGMQALEPDQLNFDRDSVSEFNPCPGSEPSDFADAAGPYAVALQIASNVSQFFSVTDEWEFTYTLPMPPVAPSTSQQTPDTSLQAAINAAGRLNSIGATSPNQHQPSHLYRNISSAQSNISQADLDELARGMLGSDSGSPGQLRTQIRFQGLWWGPERIWVDDFVRLKVLRHSLAPKGAQDISPPAGPSPKAMTHHLARGGAAEELGASHRGVFMRIDALFVVESLSEGRKKKECRASGPLFELVDEDWDESKDDNVQQHKKLFQTQPEATRSIKPLPARALPATQPPVPPSTSTQNSALGPAPISTLPRTQPPSGRPSSSSAPNHKSTPTTMPEYYLPPRSPTGFRFRPILTSGCEAVVSLSLLAGRYYPGILGHPLLQEQLKRAGTDQEAIEEKKHIWALDGLYAGFHCSVDPDKFQPSRTKMMERADREGYKALQDFKKEELAKMRGEFNDGSPSGFGSDVDMLRDDDGVSEDEGGHMLVPAGASNLDRDGDVTMR